MINLPYNEPPLTRIKQHARLTGDLKLQSLLKELDSGRAYNKTTRWESYEDDAIRLFYNRVQLDELCESLMCSHLQLEDRAKVLNVLPASYSLTAEDIELTMRLLKDGIDIKKLLDILDLDIPIETFRIDHNNKQALLEQEREFELKKRKDALNNLENQVDMLKEDS